MNIEIEIPKIACPLCDKIVTKSYVYSHCKTKCCIKGREIKNKNILMDKMLSMDTSKINIVSDEFQVNPNSYKKLKKDLDTLINTDVCKIFAVIKNN